MDRSGSTMRRGRRQPSLRGMSASTRVRNTYSTAAVVTAAGAFRLVASCGEVPVKSMVAVRAARSTVTATRMWAPVSVS